MNLLSDCSFLPFIVHKLGQFSIILCFMIHGMTLKENEVFLSLGEPFYMSSFFMAVISLPYCQTCIDVI